VNKFYITWIDSILLNLCYVLYLFKGGTAEDVKEWIDILNREKLQFPHIKLIYPSAPSQPYTPNGGMV